MLLLNKQPKRLLLVLIEFRIFFSTKKTDIDNMNNNSVEKDDDDNYNSGDSDNSPVIRYEAEITPPEVKITLRQNGQIVKGLMSPIKNAGLTTIDEGNEHYSIRFDSYTKVKTHIHTYKGRRGGGRGGGREKVVSITNFDFTIFELCFQYTVKQNSNLELHWRITSFGKLEGQESDHLPTVTLVCKKSKVAEKLIFQELKSTTTQIVAGMFVEWDISERWVKISWEVNEDVSCELHVDRAGQYGFVVSGAHVTVKSGKLCC